MLLAKELIPPNWTNTTKLERRTQKVLQMLQPKVHCKKILHLPSCATTLLCTWASRATQNKAHVTHTPPKKYCQSPISSLVNPVLIFYYQSFLKRLKQTRNWCQFAQLVTLIASPDSGQNSKLLCLWLHPSWTSYQQRSHIQNQTLLSQSLITFDSMIWPNQDKVF